MTTEAKIAIAWLNEKQYNSFTFNGMDEFVYVSYYSKLAFVLAIVIANFKSKN